MAGQPRLRGVVRHAPERHGPARRAGYVRQPHTSAGRVPTDLGYRSYVDQLLAERRTPRPRPQIEARLRRAGTVEDLLSHASQELSRASHQVGFAIAPAVDATTLERLDFVPLDGGKVLVVVVATGGHISHKVIEPTRASTIATELQQAANYLNSEFKGQSLLEVRQAVLERLREERTLYDELHGARAAAGQHDVRRTSTRRRRSSSRARRCCSTTSAREDPEITLDDAADAAADDRGEDAAACSCSTTTSTATG